MVVFEVAIPAWQVCKAAQPPVLLQIKIVMGKEEAAQVPKQI